MIGLPRSTFYYRPTKLMPAIADDLLVESIERIQDDFPCYGYRRVTV